MKVQVADAECAHPNLSVEDIIDLDEKIDRANDVLLADMRRWLEENGAGLVWQFSERLNHSVGFLDFHTASNHRRITIFDLMYFISKRSVGSHGLVYVFDDEDLGHRAQQDYSECYRVWRVFKGQVTEHDDPHFSPIKVGDPHRY